MKILKKLTVPIGEENVTIDFGHPETTAELTALHELRFKIYKKYGYLDANQYGSELESDQYDRDGSCVYFAAVVGDRPIGFVRLICKGPLPIHSAFAFTTPQVLVDTPKERLCELGRLVVDKYSETSHTPRNLILLFLTLCLTEYCETRGLRFAFAFLKTRLMGKLRTLGLPFTTIEPFTLTYPKSGPMAPYFYNESDLAVPSFFTLDTVQAFLTKTLHNKNLLEEVAPNHFSLRITLYSRFLKTIGVI